MPAAKSHVPAGYNAVMPYLRVKGAAKALDFYKAAFGAKEKFRLTMGDKLGHAEIVIAGQTIMLSDEFPEMDIVGPVTLGNTTMMLSCYVANVDKAVAKAVAAGGKIKRAANDEFYGERTAQIEDPFGHVWSLQQRLENVSPKEMQKRLDAMMAQGATDAKPSKPTPKAKSKTKTKAKG